MTRRIVPLLRVAGTAAEMSDDALVAACSVGDRSALGALFDRHYDALRAFLSRMSGTDDRDLDDLVQITFEAVPGAAKKFDRRAPVKTWLFGIGLNVVRHHVRSEVRRRRVAQAIAAEPLRYGPDASADLLARERRERLRGAMATLPDALREAFVLVYLEELPGRDAAALLGIREGTLWKRLHDARARLRETLGMARP